MAPRETYGRRSVTVIAEDELSMKLKYTLPDLVINPLKIAGQDYFTISLTDHGLEPEPGLPAVPVFSSLIDLTGRELSDIHITGVMTGRIYPATMGYRGQLMPAVESGTKGSDYQYTQFQREPTPYRQEDYYRSAKPSRSDTVTVEYLGTSRGAKIGTITISPLFYYPVDNYLDMITEMVIELTFKPVPSATVSTNSLKSASATSLLEKGLIDYNPEEVIPGFSLGPVGMVIVSDTVMRRHLSPLVEWKTRKGFRVTEIYVGSDGITKSFDSIKAKLREIFESSGPDSPAPEYIILAGDLNYIPASAGTSWLSDMYYGEFDGNGDFLPDAYIGRLPAKDTTQMKSIVRKILDYEQFNFADTIKHYESALAFTGYDIGNIPYMNGQVNYSSQYLNESNGITAHLITHNINDSVRTVRYDSVKYLMNTGVGFINYTGHGDANGWLSTGVNSTFAATLTNSLRYPVVISNACQTANYGSLNCFGSTLVRLNNKGALAFIGCSNDSYWTEDFIWAVGVSQITENPVYEESGPGFYDRLFHTHGEKPSQWYFSLGQVLHAGNMAVSESTSTKKKYYWETYTLLGDPSITPTWVNRPNLMSHCPTPSHRPSRPLPLRQSHFHM
ncbi:MAG: C25 family cysteine peptidase [Bacteroidales bacterium]